MKMRNLVGASIVLFALFEVIIYVQRGRDPRKFGRRVSAVNLPKVCVVMGSSSRETGWKTPEDSYLLKYALPGIMKTYEPNKYEYKIYVGYDTDDAFWTANSVKNVLWIPVHNPQHKPGPVFNAATRAAFHDGCEYIMRINDDSEIVTPGWTTELIAMLREMNNVGVVSPICKQGNTNIMTHDFVHRTHMLIFNDYYTPIFTDWYLDDWITRVYQDSGRSRTAKTAEVVHHIQKMRYTVNKGVEANLDREVKRGAELIAQYLKKHDGSAATSGQRFAMLKSRSWKTETVSYTYNDDLVVEKQARLWGVVTTIFPMSSSIRVALSKMCVVVVADLKTPPYNSSSDCLVFLSVADQKNLPYNIVELLPLNHFGRKNIGYLYAIHHGAERIYDFDDDNEITKFGVLERFLSDAFMTREMVSITQTAIINPYNFFSSTGVWARGFPLHLVKQSRNPTYYQSPVPETVCAIQSLADAEPDVDAVWRMVGEPYPLTFGANEKLLAVPPSSMAPFNAQATMWLRKGFSGLLLPITVHGRVSDIWRSYFLMRGCTVLFSEAWVTQTRNAHDYLADFQSEQPLYLQSEAIATHLLQTRYTDLTSTYIAMWEHNIIQHEDVKLAMAWSYDMRRFIRVPDPILQTIIAMGKAADIGHWVQHLPSNTTLLFGAFDRAPACSWDRVECIYVKGTTWAEGRNMLVDHFVRTRAPATLYMVIADADVRLQCAKPNCLQYFVDWLNAVRPPIAYLNGNDYYLVNKVPPNSMLRSDAFDAAFNAYHVDAIGTVLPYDTKFDNVSWWISQSVLWQRVHCFGFAYGMADNFYVNGDHNPYPRGRARDLEIAAQREFAARQKVPLQQASEDYKVTWDLAHVVPQAPVQWTNNCK